MKHNVIRDARTAEDKLDEIMGKILDGEMSPEQGASLANRIINDKKRQKKLWKGLADHQK
ncbi:hypothetical protein [Azospirillum humicireducens]|uniref:hypothetical protein n=1 Tax=Azospirillum humicireducens TaxID=1226968 RepID=UPI0011B259AC|nr:hypothetical protein [Azospirillum humicireducens]